MAREEKIRKVIQQAQSLTADLPAALQARAFQTVLEHLLGGGLAAAGRTAEIADEAPRDEVALPPDHLVKEHGSREQQVAWAVVKLHQRGEAATPASVMAAIKGELGSTPPTRPQTSTLLKNLVPRFMTRVKEGRGFAYVPTASIGTVLAGLEKEK